MNNYCAATDFIKWNESFAVIFGHNNVMMKREDIGEKYVDKRLYILMRIILGVILSRVCSELYCLFMRQNKTIPKVNDVCCIVLQTYYLFVC